MIGVSKTVYCMVLNVVFTRTLMQKGITSKDFVKHLKIDKGKGDRSRGKRSPPRHFGCHSIIIGDGCTRHAGVYWADANGGSSPVISPGARGAESTTVTVSVAPTRTPALIGAP